MDLDDLLEDVPDKNVVSKAPARKGLDVGKKTEVAKKATEDEWGDMEDD